MHNEERSKTNYEYFMNHDFLECKKCFDEKRELPFCGENCIVWLESNEDLSKVNEVLKRFVSDEDFRKEVFERNHTEEYL